MNKGRYILLALIAVAITTVEMVHSTESFSENFEDISDVSNSTSGKEYTTYGPIAGVKKNKIKPKSVPKRRKNVTNENVVVTKISFGPSVYATELQKIVYVSKFLLHRHFAGPDDYPVGIFRGPAIRTYHEDDELTADSGRQSAGETKMDLSEEFQLIHTLYDQLEGAMSMKQVVTIGTGSYESLWKEKRDAKDALRSRQRREDSISSILHTLSRIPNRVQSFFFGAVNHDDFDAEVNKLGDVGEAVSSMKKMFQEMESHLNISETNIKTLGKKTTDKFNNQSVEFYKSMKNVTASALGDRGIVAAAIEKTVLFNLKMLEVQRWQLAVEACKNKYLSPELVAADTLESDLMAARPHLLVKNLDYAFESIREYYNHKIVTCEVKNVKKQFRNLERLRNVDNDGVLIMDHKVGPKHRTGRTEERQKLHDDTSKSRLTPEFASQEIDLVIEIPLIVLNERYTVKHLVPVISKWKGEKFCHIRNLNVVAVYARNSKKVTVLEAKEVLQNDDPLLLLPQLSTASELSPKCLQLILDNRHGAELLKYCKMSCFNDLPTSYSYMLARNVVATINAKLLKLTCDIYDAKQHFPISMTKTPIGRRETTFQLNATVGHVISRLDCGCTLDTGDDIVVATFPCGQDGQNDYFPAGVNHEVPFYYGVANETILRSVIDGETLRFEVTELTKVVDHDWLKKSMIEPETFHNYYKPGQHFYTKKEIVDSIEGNWYGSWSTENLVWLLVLIAVLLFFCPILITILCGGCKCLYGIHKRLRKFSGKLNTRIQMFNDDADKPDLDNDSQEGSSKQNKSLRMNSNLKTENKGTFDDVNSEKVSYDTDDDVGFLQDSDKINVSGKRHKKLKQNASVKNGRDIHSKKMMKERPTMNICDKMEDSLDFKRPGIKRNNDFYNTDRKEESCLRADCFREDEGKDKSSIYNRLFKRNVKNVNEGNSGFNECNIIGDDDMAAQQSSNEELSDNGNYLTESDAEETSRLNSRNEEFSVNIDTHNFE